MTLNAGTDSNPPRPVEPQSPRSAPAPPPRRRLTLVLVVAAVVVVAGVSLYVLTRPPPIPSIPLTVTDGSTTGVIEGSFASYTSTNASLVRTFNATTYANESDGQASSLALSLYSWTYFDGFHVITNVFVTMRGGFASNLEPGELTLTYNQTGRFTQAYGHAWSSPTNLSFGVLNDSVPGPMNVSTNPGHVAYVSGPGSAVLTASLVNRTDEARSYEFVFPAFFSPVQYPIGYNHLFGFRATATGRFTPAVSVGILLDMLYVVG